MSSVVTVVKRDGTEQAFDAEKLNKWAEWAGGIGVDWSSIVLEAVRKCQDKCPTSDLHKALEDACNERQTEAYAKMAGRLFMGRMLKEVFGSIDSIPTVGQMYAKMIADGLWDDMGYSEEDLAYSQSVIAHSRDLEAPLNVVKQCMDKYAISDKTTGKVYETPQFVYMRMALGNMAQMPKERRMKDVERLYHYLSTKRINPPSPFSLNLGTKRRQYASCSTAMGGDTIDSLAAVDLISYVMTSASAGIGTLLQTRSKGDAVRQGTIRHLGKLPYYRHQLTAVAANLQASRGGANTMHYTVLDPEFFSLIRLKDVQQIPELQIIGLDYSLSYNDFFAERVRKNEDWMLVSYGAAPKLYAALYGSDCNAFAQEFEAVKNNPLIKKEIVPARKVALAFLSATVASGREYETSLTAMNAHTPFKEPIRQSNLCVAPETLVLTDKGHWPIKMLAGTKVNVWNGHEFSEVTPCKTSDASELVKVILSDGRVLECTKEHKFYKAVGYRGKEVEVMAANLQAGDKLIKLSTPVIEGSLYLHKAYANGFYTGDGCEVDGKSRIYLYNEKRELLPMFEPANKVTVQEGRTYFYEDGLQKKFFVPSALYSVGSRLSWLAGLLDADGCVVSCQGAQTIQLVSVNSEFLRDLQYMLQTLGVQAKVHTSSEGGMRPLPKNDGTGESKEYLCKPASRILIATKGVQTLLSLGLDTKRLKLSVAKPDRCAMRFPTVAAVEHTGRVCETYCFTEPKRNRGVFNGILTGQCQEINLVTNEYESPADLYKQEDASGEIGLCNIAAIDSSIVSDEEYEEVAYYTALSIDNVMSLMDYPFPHLRYTATRRRSIGVGITNLAYTMAKNGQRYDTAEGKKFIAKIAERHSFYLHKAGLKLAKERGCCEWAHKTKYPDGWLPIDTANKNAMALFDGKLHYDWDPLRQAIIEQGGLRFSVLEAHMPCETSSGAAGHTNGLYPIRQHVMVKTSGNNKVTFIAPEAEALKEAYQLAWDLEWKDLTDLYAIVQCFTGQGISADYYVRYTPDNLSISGKKLLTDWLYRVKMGMKSRYYINTSSALAAKEESSEPVCDSCSL